MAKQTFTTGQVLTAAQMTSLQQTAMLGGAASAKTASYTLVAADAGTAISMSNAGATTITVNTALFAAGDTVQITNLGAGVCTITAGTATVNTSASLALAQYESGTLDFTSTSAAIFIKAAGAAAASGGANWSLLNAGGTSLTGTSTSITGITGKDKLMIELRNVSHNAATNYFLNIQFNTDTGNNYRFVGFQYTGASSYAASNLGKFNLTTDSIELFQSSSAANNDGAGYVQITGCNSSGVKVFTASGSSNAGSGVDAIGRSGGGVYNSASTISSVQIKISGGTFDDGQVFIYGSA
jgi:hypothetical protein